METFASNVDGDVLTPRSYQKEMLQDSLQRNIIVAMDTGSGKTQVAVLRIAAELDRCPPEKLVWFLAPTVTLAEQQYNVLRSQLPSVQCRLLVGSDGVDRWSTQVIWDEVLYGIQVMVTTPDVLLDALTHGFVGMTKLALLVLDEAHCCILDHPSNRIMRNFYHPCLKSGKAPHMLGLTASPIFNGKLGGLQMIEQNMNAICRTPRLYREQLLQHVHRPTMKAMVYQQDVASTATSSALQSLKEVYTALDIQQDPYVLKLRAAGYGTDSKQLRKTLMNRKTYCQDQIRGFLNTANTISELGPWATDYYITTCLQRFRLKKFPESFNFDGLDTNEKAYLRKMFAEVRCPNLETSLNVDFRITQKVHRLIDILVMEMHEEFTGLIFVKTRASVGVLAYLLSTHPRTREILKIGTFVGTSSHSQRQSNVGELVSINEQSETLDDLKQGKKNLIISTSILEEGIDVTALNFVCCFEPPPNLKSFIQRRGRARQAKSKYIVMFPEDVRSTSINTWQKLEEEMKQIYMDDMRRLAELQDLETGEAGSRDFVVESTGAKLTLHNAVQHLHHFCAILPAAQHADLRPSFSFEYDSTGVRASATLPNSVDTSLRHFRSRTWRTEKYAKRDAAFEAYVALYNAGLVNDHLLPLIGYEEAQALAAVEQRESLVVCSDQFNPWPGIARTWQSRDTVFESLISLKSQGHEIFIIRLLSPGPLPHLSSLELHWDSRQSYSIDISLSQPRIYDDATVDVSSQITNLILHSIYRNRMKPNQSDFPLLFIPAKGTEDLRVWLRMAKGTDVPKDCFSPKSKELLSLVRDKTQNGMAHIFHAFEHRQRTPDLSAAMEAVEEPTGDCLHLKVTKLSKRADFLHPIPLDAKAKQDSGFLYIPAEKCEIDRLPFAYSQFAMFIPSLMHHIEIAMVADNLCHGLLSPIEFEKIDLVKTAITASVARDTTNYQRLEFLGDSVLKFLTALTLMTQHKNWHEGYLSHAKDHVVSNARLARAAKQINLDRSIVTRPFTGYKWRPLYNKDLIDMKPTQTRELSTKVLADVVEALVGAALLDGGNEKALRCLSVLIPDVSWQPLDQYHAILSEMYSTSQSLCLPVHFVPVEDLIQYKFNTNLLLLEALTYPSYIDSNPTPSYQRLEFLGDSILDFIVTNRLFKHKPDLSHQTMHLIRTGVVNANFLAFHCMNLTVFLLRRDPVQDKSTGLFSTIETPVSRSIWQYLRHSSLELVVAQKRCLARFEYLRSPILEALSTGQSYPWTLLARFDADKFFSDIIESIIGALYIDSAGSIPVCEAFLERLGWMLYFERVLRDTVHMLHPKEELGRVAGNEKVKYENWEERRSENGVEEGGWACRVWVGEREVCKAGQGRSCMEVETRAADEAVRILRGEKAGETGDVEMGDAGMETEAVSGDEQAAFYSCNED